MLARPVWQKMGIKEGERALYVGAPDTAIKAIDAPPLSVHTEPEGKFDYINLFVTTQADMDARFPVLKQHLAPTGKLWVSWPKAGKLGTDLAIAHVIRIGYTHGLVESVNLRIDDTWTSLKFTWPKPGKTYNNSYGTLPGVKK